MTAWSSRQAAAKQPLGFARVYTLQVVLEASKDPRYSVFRAILSPFKILLLSPFAGLANRIKEHRIPSEVLVGSHRAGPLGLVAEV